MSSPETIDVLNRILAINVNSFAQYLRFARPYVPPGQQRAWETLGEIVAGENALADRISQLIVDSDAVPDRGEFPIDFTDAHDLGLAYLIQRAIACQTDDLTQLEECAASLELAPAAQSLANEAVGTAKGHLQSLQELAEGGLAA